MARRVKTWLQANMNHQKFNRVVILQTNKKNTNKIKLADVANEFA